MRLLNVSMVSSSENSNAEAYSAVQEFLTVLIIKKHKSLKHEHVLLTFTFRDGSVLKQDY